MIGQYNRFVIVNNSGYTLTYNDGARITLNVIGYYINPSTGKIAYNTVGADTCGFTASSSLANGEEIISSSEYANATDLYLGYLVEMDITHDLAASCAGGTCDLYLATGTSSGAVQTDATGYLAAETNKLPLVGTLTFPTGLTNDDRLFSETFTL